MLNPNTINDLFRHMEWADAEVWSSILASSKAVTDNKLQEYLYHLHVVQRTFFLLWRGESLEGLGPKFDDAQSLMNWGRSYYGEANEYLSGLNEGDLNQPIVLPWSSMIEKRLGRAPESTTKGETALQVAMHSTYHRGQVNARLRELGGEPPLVDYIVWLWHGRPAPKWP